MGCDAYTHIEVKINDNWEHYTYVNMSRNHDLYGTMANVRNENNRVNPISKPRGMPDDANKLTKFEANVNDGRYHSFLSMDEMIFLEKEMLEVYNYAIDYGYIFGNNLENYRNYPEDTPEGVTDIRLVFWFSE